MICLDFWTFFSDFQIFRNFLPICNFFGFFIDFLGFLGFFLDFLGFFWIILDLEIFGYFEFFVIFLKVTKVTTKSY